MAELALAVRFGERLKALIENAKETDADMNNVVVAEALGVTPQTVSGYLAGTHFVGADKVEALAKRWDYDLAEFFAPKGSPIPMFTRPSQGVPLANAEVASHAKAVARVLAHEAVSPEELSNALTEVLQCLTVASVRLKSAIADREAERARKNVAGSGGRRRRPNRPTAPRLKSPKVR